MTAKPADALRPKIEAAMSEANKYAVRTRRDVELRPPEQIRKFANALLVNWEWSLRSDTDWVDQQVEAAWRDFRQTGGSTAVAVSVPQSKGTINALKELRKFEECVLELWRLKGGMCEEATGAIVNMNESYNRHHDKNSAINDRLKELASIAVSARMTMESAPPTRAKSGRKTSAVARNISDHLARDYHKLAGEPPTKSNHFPRLVRSVFEALGLAKASADSCAKTAVERYRGGKGSEIKFKIP